MSNDVIYDHRPFTIVYDDVISDIKDPLAIAVYVTLCKYANSDKVCHPSQKQIAEDLGLSASSVKTVRRALRSLEEQGYLKQFRRWRDDKGGVSRVKDKRFSIPTSNGYVIFSELAGVDKSVDKVDKSVEFDAQLGSFSPTTIGSADRWCLNVVVALLPKNELCQPLNHRIRVHVSSFRAEQCLEALPYVRITGEPGKHS